MKMCPLVTQAEHPCDEEKCAWFYETKCPEYRECAILMIAKTLAEIALRSR